MPAALSATDKKPYAEEAAKRKLQYEKELKAFLEAGGEKKKTKQILDVMPTKRRKKETTVAKGDDTTPSRKRKNHVNAHKDDKPTPSKERKKDANAPKAKVHGPDPDSEVPYRAVRAHWQLLCFDHASGYSSRLLCCRSISW